MNANAENSKPLSVRCAVTCMWISVVLAVIIAVLQFVGILPSANRVVVAATGIVTPAVLSLVAAKVSTGRNWARWLFIALCFMGSLLFMVSAVFAPQAFLLLPTPLQASGIVQCALQTVAAVLLFTRASRQWFGHRMSQLRQVRSNNSFQGTRRDKAAPNR